MAKGSRRVLQEDNERGRRMKIEDNRKDVKVIAIRKLQAGDVIEYYGDIFIVTSKRSEHLITCVNVATGMFGDFKESVPVIPIDAKVVIE